MEHKEREIKSKDSKDEQKMANERRIDELLNINNRYVRTQRHLEQHSDLSHPDNLRHAEDIQQEREEEMDKLKSLIAYGEPEEEDEVDNLRRNLYHTDGYLEEQADDMDDFTLEKTKEKQSHRRQQLELQDD
ncbi:MAG: hypothetical protein GX974_00020 [Clostridiales bacterium]|nr:hypothetical protein [Clostridiales bacterium]